jgi:glycerol-3-phosphate acyltransferase PlsY
VLSLALLFAAYLLGSFPTGVVVARAKGVDLRRVGSGNIGTANVGRALGRGWAALVLLVDASKGALPVVLAGRLSPEPWLPAAAGLAAVLGQVFTIFLRGRGGKGVATSLGAGLALAPLAALASAAVWAALYAAFRIASLGSLAAVLCFPTFLWLLGPVSPFTVAFAAAATLLIFARHRDNIRRLARGQEHRA